MGCAARTRYGNFHPVGGFSPAPGKGRPDSHRADPALPLGCPVQSDTPPHHHFVRPGGLGKACLAREDRTRLAPIHQATAPCFDRPPPQAGLRRPRALSARPPLKRANQRLMIGQAVVILRVSAATGLFRVTPGAECGSDGSRGRGPGQDSGTSISSDGDGPLRMGLA